MNTPIQEAIEKLESVITMWKDPSNEMDFEHTLMTFKSELESLLEKEKEVFIDFGLDCQEEMYCDNNGDLKALGRPDTLFKQIFNGK